MNKSRKRVLSIVLSGLLIFVFASFVSAYGTSPAGAPICNSTSPKAPWPISVKIAGLGAVDVTWSNVESASSWTVAYGVKSGKYIYGLHNFGNGASRSVKIGSLPSGTYYFVVRANNGCAPGPFSAESRISVGGSGGTTTVSYTGSTQGTPLPTLRPTATPKTIVGTGTPIPTPKGGAGTLNATPRPIATPSPQSVGFWQSIANFFSGLFK